MNRKEALKILNLKDSGTLTTTKIKKTYYAMALKLHPDKGGDEEEFKKIKPKTMGQALRIDGITPAAVYILLSHLKRKSIKHIA